jgi:hypothetical protein
MTREVVLDRLVNLARRRDEIEARLSQARSGVGAPPKFPPGSVQPDVILENE